MKYNTLSSSYYHADVIVHVSLDVRLNVIAIVQNDIKCNIKYNTTHGHCEQCKIPCMHASSRRSKKVILLELCGGDHVFHWESHKSRLFQAPQEDLISKTLDADRGRGPLRVTFAWESSLFCH